MGWTAARSASYDIRIGETTRFIVSATNADGSTRADAVVYTKVRVGYHDASTPAGGIPEAEVRRIRGELEDNDRRLNAGCIRNNDELDRFGDPYLRGQLTDDILAAMRQVLIITDRDRLPSRYRETARLCTDGVYGEVPTDKAYLAICREVGADELTLLHELYHYAAIRDSGNEFKAEAISTGCY
jgi:hypothetical protein